MVSELEWGVEGILVGGRAASTIGNCYIWGVGQISEHTENNKNTRFLTVRAVSYQYGKTRINPLELGWNWIY